MQQELRKAALRDEIGDGLARERIKRIRTKAAHDRCTFLGRVALNQKHARLRKLDEKQRRILILGFDRQSQRDFDVAVANVTIRVTQIELGLRSGIATEYLRSPGRLERHVLDVDLLQQ